MSATPIDEVPGQRMLRRAALLSAVGAVLHLAALVLGGPWYRTMGAGEQIARMAEHGHWYPPVATLVISAILLVWAAYALSGADLMRRLPLLRTVLIAVTAVYLLRGVAGLLVLGTRLGIHADHDVLDRQLACLPGVRRRARRRPAAGVVAPG